MGSVVKVLVVTLFAYLAMMAVGCGTDEEAEQARADAEAQVAELEDDLDKAEAQLAIGEDCETQMRAFMRSLGDLDGLLTVGLSYDEYSDNVQDIAVAYNRIDFKSLDFECVSGVGLDAEKSFRHYAEAEQVWGDCITDFSCDTDSIDPQLQTEWNDASKELASAERSLREMSTGAEEEIADLEDELDEAESQLTSE